MNIIHQVEAFFKICQGIVQGWQLLSGKFYFVKNFIDVIMLCNFNIFYKNPSGMVDTLLKNISTKLVKYFNIASVIHIRLAE